ncbi:MAG: sulfite exporter TauE/SafE family protein, partial [Geminicoccaceae bacterium]
MNAAKILPIAAIFVMAGLVKGVTGLGLPTVGVGLLGLFLPPAEAAALVLVPALATNLWQMLAGPALGPLCRRLWPLLAGICLGTWTGGRLLGAVDAAHATMALGTILLLYALLGLAGLRPSCPPGRLGAGIGLMAGIATGAVTAVTGVFVIPAVPFLQALGLGRAELVQALGLSFTVSTASLAVLLAGSGILGGERAWQSLLALAPALLGLTIGGRLSRSLRPETFRRCFYGGLLLLGGHLALRPLL